MDFLATEQKARYGQFSGEPNEAQLMRYFHLDEVPIPGSWVIPELSAG
ncbi:hypothetical protein [Methylomagnum sp.]